MIKKDNYLKNNELLMRKRAIVFDTEITEWMLGIIIWLIILVGIVFVGIFSGWVIWDLGGIGIALWLLYALMRARQVKMENLHKNMEAVMEVENAKKEI